MAVALASLDSPAQAQPRSCSLQIPRHDVDKQLSASASLRTVRTDPDLGLGGLDLSFFDDKLSWGVLEGKLDFNLTREDDDAHGHSFKAEEATIPSIEGDLGDQICEPAVSTATKPFQKWMRSLQKRARRANTPSASEIFTASDEHGHEPSRPRFPTRHSSSGSSFAFVTAVHSASISLASASLVAPRRRRAVRSSHGWTERSSRASTPAPRFSEDSYFEIVHHPDAEVIERSLQRRRILEELLRTEENYISDIRFLMNVYITILASLPTQHEGLRQSINRNLTEIVELHEGILGELHLAVPFSEYPAIDPATARPPANRHHRWHSLDSVTENDKEKRRSWNTSGMSADPGVAAEVARIFGSQTHRFFVYEEYGAKYEMMIKDIASAQQTLPKWESYQKGLEALAASLGSEHQHLDHSKKSLTIGDLLVKPIQRVCRYPLLFSELLKYTPACDCPDSQVEIENVLCRLREATSEINRATDDPNVKASLEKTWLLQDRLAYPDQVMNAGSRSTIRSFGQVQLCGALHVCWQTWDGVKGLYMVSLLYKDRLCLAVAEKGDQRYTIRLCIGLSGARVEDVDNGRGLQCHTAPFSWKLVFEHDCQLYEVIMTACNPKEEAEWRSRLTRPECDQIFGVSETTSYDSMSLNIKSLGTIFGKPGTVARRVSIQRATTVGPKSALYQVILKNTTTVKDTSSAIPTSAINRSQSLLTTNSRVPVLAPPQGERARLEALLADVWSRSSLPFPGITSRSRSEQLVRSSASTVMRKLSVASISSSFAKRATPGVATPKRNVDRPVPSTSYGEYNSPHKSEMVDVDKRLPIIKDEFERSSASLARTPAREDSAENVSQSGSVRRFKSAKSYEVLRRGEDFITLGSPVLRTTSINSFCSRTPSSKSLSPCIEKENVIEHAPPMPAVPDTQKLLGKKWSRVKTMNRSFKASGLRSLFR